MDSATPVPPRIRDYLARAGARFEVLGPTASVAARNHVRATLLTDARGCVLALYPASHTLQLMTLNAQLGRQLVVANEPQRTQAFPDCDPHSVPALGEPYGIETCVDRSLDALRMLVLDSGAARTTLEVTAPTFAQLQAHARRGLSFATEHGAPRSDDSPLARLPRLNIKMRLTHSARLPTMPQAAQQLLRLRAHPDAGARDLSNAVRNDPSVAAQILRYANSPFFGAQRRIESLDQAVVVLGYDAALNVALGIALLGGLRLPSGSRLGLGNLWRDAVYCASTCEQLARQLPAGVHVKPGLAYLAGLLQNLGYVLLAHSFSKELFWLHKATTFHPQIPVLDIERHVLGLTHAQLGGELLRDWSLPAEIVAGVEYHHDPDYGGEHARYAQLVLLANRALARNGIGDETDDALPPAIVTALALSESVIVKVSERILAAHTELDHLAQLLAA